MLNTPRYVPAWLIVDQPSIFTKGKSLMSLISKILTKKDAADSIAPEARLEKEINAAVGAALTRGCSIFMALQMLERAENDLRFRQAAGLRF
jgi:hypothetical protein